MKHRNQQALVKETVPTPTDPERLDETFSVEIGQWYWLSVDGDEFSEDPADKKPHEVLTCVTKVGTNFTKVESPHGRSWRVHHDEFEEDCRRELNPEIEIQRNADKQKGIVRQTLAKIQEVTARLGLTPRGAITQQKSVESRELAVVSGTDHLKKYKTSLVRAKNTHLPALFKKVEESTKELTIWMKAQTLPMKGHIGGMKDCIEDVEGRIFSVSLYAGLSEDVVQVRKGEAAPSGEKLRIMQRRLYMDEECLAGYKAGGIDITSLKKFDQWLAKRENRDRLLPFPRCLVVFRVRRDEKHRESPNMNAMRVNIDLAKDDKPC